MRYFQISNFKFQISNGISPPSAESQCTNQPTVFVSPETIGCEITVKMLSLSFLIQ